MDIVYLRLRNNKRQQILAVFTQRVVSLASNITGSINQLEDNRALKHNLRIGTDIGGTGGIDSKLNQIVRTAYLR